MSSGAVFHARGLTKVYRVGEVDVHGLRGVDLELFEGELVVLLGPSGSGKSKLLNILVGLDVPTGAGALPEARAHGGWRSRAHRVLATPRRLRLPVP